MSDLIISNGYIYDPGTGREGPGTIRILGDKIEEILWEQPQGEQTGAGGDAGTELKDMKRDCPVIDASGCIVAPGLVDVHVHFRDPGFTQKEDIETGAAAARAGGYTSVVMMANTVPHIDTPETLKYVLDKGATTGIHVYACANVTMDMKGQSMVDMERMAELGAVGFTDDGVPILDEQLAREAMRITGELKMPISFHEEDPRYIVNNGINQGHASEAMGIGGSDRQAEVTMVARDLKLAEGTGAIIDIQHISARESVELVRQARNRGVNVHAEATPHHFTLTEAAVTKYGTLAKMNPPLRTEADRMAIIEGLKDGTIDMIATDHAPHTTEEKAGEFTKAPSGIIGLETALSLGIMELVDKGHLTMMELMTRMSLGPAKVYCLDAGYLAVGGPADIVIFDPKREYIAGDYCSKASNSPFTGWTLRGRVLTTICGGQIVYEK